MFVTLFQIPFGVPPAGPKSVSVNWKSNLRITGIDFWKCSIHRNSLQRLSQQLLATLYCVKDALCGFVQGQCALLNTAQAMLYPCMTILQEFCVGLYFPVRLCSKLQQPNKEKSVRERLAERVFGAHSYSPGFICTILGIRLSKSNWQHSNTYNLTLAPSHTPESSHCFLPEKQMNGESTCGYPWIWQVYVRILSLNRISAPWNEGGR